MGASCPWSAFPGWVGNCLGLSPPRAISQHYQATVLPLFANAVAALSGPVFSFNQLTSTARQAQTRLGGQERTTHAKHASEFKRLAAHSIFNRASGCDARRIALVGAARHFAAPVGIQACPLRLRHRARRRRCGQQ